MLVTWSALESQAARSTRGARSFRFSSPHSQSASFCVRSTFSFTLPSFSW